MNKLIFSIDMGKGFTKYARSTNNGSIITGEFPTRFDIIKDNGDKKLGDDKDSFKVEYLGTSYIIGKAGTRDLRDERNKKSDFHRLAMLVSVTQLLRGSELNTTQNIHIVIAIQASSYKNIDFQEALKKYLIGEGGIEIKVNGKKYKFNLTSCLVLPEGFGFKYRHKSLCLGRSIVVDLGHLNMGLQF